MIEPVGLQVGAGRLDFGNGRLRQNLCGDILDRGIRDLVDEADVPVFAGRDAGDHLPPRDLGIDDGLAPAPAVIDHHDEILHGHA